MTETLSPDYARFTINNGQVIPGEKMLRKLAALKLPDFKDKRVLDVGCDYGQFSFWAASQGAKEVVGIDRNRDVRGVGKVNLVDKNNENAIKYFPRCCFFEMNLGKQWKEFGGFDYILMMNLYHHIFQNVGEHKPIWYWLYRHGGKVIWENPTDLQDGVSNAHIHGGKRDDYSREKILEAASEYFDYELQGQGHVDTRSVYLFTPKEREKKEYRVSFMDGAGGATPAFLYQDGRRQKEIAKAVGYLPFAGSLNLVTDKPFHWDKDYYRAEVLDVSERGRGLDVPWNPRMARFYPLEINGVKCHAFKFEGEKYPDKFVELIAPQRLRSVVKEPAVLA